MGRRARRLGRSAGARPAAPTTARPTGLDALVAAVGVLPVPASPPPYDLTRARAGLGLLAAVREMAHVRRLSETLRFVEDGTVRRSLTLDLSLDLLTREQREAAMALDRIRAVGPTDPTTDLAWVPVATESREVLSEVRLTDGHGAPVPMLTGGEATNLLSNGIRAAFRAHIASLASGPRRPAGTAQPDGPAQLDGPAQPDGPDHLVRSFLAANESRWLLDTALDLVLRTGGRAAPPDLASPAATQGSRQGSATSSEGAEQRSWFDVQRRRVLDLLGQHRDDLAGLDWLLRVTGEGMIVVAGLDRSVQEHVLSLDTTLPAVRVRRHRRGWTRPIPGRLITGQPGAGGPTRVADELAERWRRLRLTGSTYVVEYRTRLPAALGTYHFGVQTGSDVRVAGLSLVDDAHQAAITGLAADLRHLADLLERGEPRWPGAAGLLEVEAQGVLQRVAALYRRVQRTRGALFGAAAPPTETPGLAVLQALAHDGSWVRSTATGAEHSGGVLGRSELTPSALRGCADEIDRAELGREARIGVRRPAAEAHLRWTPPPGAVAERPVVEVTAGACLVDGGEVHTGNLPLFFLALAVLSVVPLLPFSGTIQAGALTTILLFTPGFLFSRLRFAGSGTVAGRLLSGPRRAAMVAAVCSTAVAVSVAIDASDQLLLLVAAPSAALQLLLAGGITVPALLRGRTDPQVTLPTAALPTWARGPELKASRRPDRVFEARW